MGKRILFLLNYKQINKHIPKKQKKTCCRAEQFNQSHIANKCEDLNVGLLKKKCMLFSTLAHLFFILFDSLNYVFYSVLTSGIVSLQEISHLYLIFLVNMELRSNIGYEVQEL